MSTVLNLKVREETSPESVAIHAPFYPADVYLGEKIHAQLLVHGAKDQNKLSMPVWRLSPLGVELIASNDPKADSLATTGATVDLWIQMHNQMCEFRGLVVGTEHSEKGRRLIGIRWCMDQKDSSSDGQSAHLERRAAQRWLCGNDFLPTGIAPNPVRFNDFIHFRVKDISTSGMMLVTSLRNKTLIPGMKLETTISFPMCAQLAVKLKIARAWIIQQNGQDYLALGVSILNPEPDLLNTIGQYVFQFGPKTSIEELRKHGMRVSAPTNAMDFSFVRTNEEYREVLALRHLAYTRAGKMAADAPIENAGDIYDSRSRIVMARHRGELIGTLRIIFHNPEDHFEHEEHFPIPESFPRKDEVVEITRLCTHPDFRRADIFYDLIRKAILTALQAGRRWIFSSAASEIYPLYIKFGAKSLGVEYQHKLLANMEHKAFLLDIPKVMTGDGINPILWNAFLSELTTYMKGQELLEFDPGMNIRMAMYKTLKPITPFLVARLRRPRRMKTKA